MFQNGGKWGKRMAHFIRNVLTAAVLAGGVYFLYTKAVGSDPDFDIKNFSLDEIDKPDYEIDGDDMFDEHYDILEGDIPIREIEDMQTCKNLDVDMGGCVFKICLSEDDSFMVQAENMDKYQCYVENSSLVIRGTGAVVDLSDINMKKSEVTLYVPDDFVFSGAELELGAGSMEIESIMASELDLECGAGMIDVQYADTADGEFKCSAGSINVKLSGAESDYNYTIESAVGLVQIGDKSYSGVADRQDIGNNSEKAIDIECAMGSIKIGFAVTPTQE